MLHVLNGDATLEALAGTRIPGDRLAFREALVTGPTPHGVDADEWHRIRAEHLAAEGGGDPAAIEADLRRQDAALDDAARHDEVVLWFEPDLFCQVNLIHLLDRLGRSEAPPRLISLVEPEEAVEDFWRPFPMLDRTELHALFEARRRVTEAEIALAAEAWGAWRSPDPTVIERVLSEETDELPHLHDALLLHLARFPSTRNGLGQVENVALDRIVEGVGGFERLFREFAEAEPGYGLGDLQFLAALDRLTRGREPLLVRENGGAPAEARFRPTEAGRRAAASELDYLEANDLDVWLGGTHLHPGAPLWRWDERREELVPDEQES